MIIGIDIGNTHIVTGIYDGNGELISTFRIATNDKMTEDEYFSYFNNITKYNNVSIEKVNAVLAYSSQFYDSNSNEPTTPISDRNFLDSVTYRARDLGRLIGTDFAEGFTCERVAAVNTLFNLK